MRRKRERKTRSSVYIPLEVSWRKPRTPSRPIDNWTLVPTVQAHKSPKSALTC